MNLFQILIDCHVLSIDISSKLAKGGNLSLRELSPLVSGGGKILTETCFFSGPLDFFFNHVCSLINAKELVIFMKQCQQVKC